VSHYRDPLAGLESQVAVKRGALETREREVSPLFFSLLPASLQDRIRELRPRAIADGESLDALSDADAALDAILAAYDEAVRLGPELRTCPDEIRDPRRPNMPEPWLIEEPGLVMFREHVKAALASAVPDAVLVRWGDSGYLSRFRVAGDPFVFRIDAVLNQDVGAVVHHQSELRTSVPRALGRLEVRRERSHHVVGKALHLAREHETGDAAFDRQFWITGSAPSLALLTPAVREGLTSLHAFSPVLAVDVGVATVTWSAGFFSVQEGLMPPATVETLAGLRHAVSRA
jgi:hypothetical protein